MRTLVLTAARAVALLVCVSPGHAAEQPVGSPFPSLPLPPEIGPPAELTRSFPSGRKAHIELIRREAHHQGVPADVADAVAYVESSYNPHAVGAVGEVGLMQIRPETASMLGYKGGVTGLFDPEVNVRFSVNYLAGAWRRAGGDLCRTLMKYRADHGEERMSPLSAEYCRRARGYLAAIGSPLGQGAAPSVGRPNGPFAALKSVPQVQRPPLRVAQAGRELLTPPRRPGPERIRLASSDPVTLSSAQIRAIAQRGAFERMRKLRGAQFWAAHEARIKVITANLKASQLRIATGI